MSLGINILEDCSFVNVEGHENPVPYRPLDPYRKDKTMRYKDDYTAVATSLTVQSLDPDTTRREYLTARLRDATWKHEKELDTHFTGFERPKSLKEAEKRLKAGEWSIDNRGMDPNAEFNTVYFSDYFTWRTTPPDQKGLKAARELLATAKTEALDVIAIADPAEGLKALQKFETRKFH